MKHVPDHGPKWSVNFYGETVCQHGTAIDVHCCNCHSGFLFDELRCVCGLSDAIVNADKIIDPRG